MYTFIRTYMYMYVYVHVYIYVYSNVYVSVRIILLFFQFFCVFKYFVNSVLFYIPAPLHAV